MAEFVYDVNVWAHTPGVLGANFGDESYSMSPLGTLNNPMLLVVAVFGGAALTVPTLVGDDPSQWEYQGTHLDDNGVRWFVWNGVYPGDGNLDSVSIPGLAAYSGGVVTIAGDPNTAAMEYEADVAAQEGTYSAPNFTPDNFTTTDSDEVVLYVAIADDNQGSGEMQWAAAAGAENEWSPGQQDWDTDGTYEVTISATAAIYHAPGTYTAPTCDDVNIVPVAVDSVMTFGLSYWADPTAATPARLVRKPQHLADLSELPYILTDPDIQGRYL